MIHLKYLRYVMLHKWYVFIECFRFGIVWRGLKHYLSKFEPCEWIPYAEYFYGEYPDHVSGLLRSEYGARDKSDIETAFNIAWNHHQKMNDHHWQYWVILNDDGTTIALDMPINARKEMLSDWIGAGKALGKPDTKQWYTKNSQHMILHENTRKWVESNLL